MCICIKIQIVTLNSNKINCKRIFEKRWLPKATLIHLNVSIRTQNVYVKQKLAYGLDGKKKIKWKGAGRDFTRTQIDRIVETDAGDLYALRFLL